MGFGNRGVAAYRNVSVSSAVPYADSVHLIQMLFDGLMVSLADAEGHIERKDIKAKTESIGRATKILNGLQGALDFEKGAEIAINLSDLYDYCVRRLLKASIRNDPSIVREVRGLMFEIQDAWSTLPELLSKNGSVPFAS
ncbi:MAG: flagellar export chaperone FliS [Porticoccaceae bacterium]|jgi:flagellar protein FliS|tara:strand:- start:412 stop:831 length:420 start_codon:yes stop_codon:yes gene_type:complete